MKRAIVIGDDLTGCNATSALFRELGWRITTRIDHQDTASAWWAQSGVFVWNSGSRLLSEEQAISRARQMMQHVSSAADDENVLWGRRIDSTLRGHVVVEAEAMLDALPNLDCGVVVVAFPASGRVVRDGRLYVHGVPVNETEIGRDPYTPVLDADVCQVLSAKAHRPVHRLPLELLDSPASAGEEIGLLLESGLRPFLVCDAVTDADIQGWADLFASLPVSILSIDPGPFSPAYMAAKQRVRHRALVVSGSLMPTAVEQLDVLEAVYDTKLVRVHLDRLLNPETHRSEQAQLVTEVLSGLEHCNVVGFRTDGFVPSSVDQGQPIAQAIAELAVAILSETEFNGVYVSGGEVAYETLRALDACALEPMKQICPLGVLSRVVDGPRTGLHVVTKGGSVGHKEALVDSVRLLLSSLDEEVTTEQLTTEPDIIGGPRR